MWSDLLVAEMHTLLLATSKFFSKINSRGDCFYDHQKWKIVVISKPNPKLLLLLFEVWYTYIRIVWKMIFSCSAEFRKASSQPLQRSNIVFFLKIILHQVYRQRQEPLEYYVPN